MSTQSNVDALKAIAAAIFESYGVSADDIPGTTIPEVLDYIARYYNSGPPILKPLTVSSSSGSSVGKTKITVSPVLTEGNSYRYKVAVSVDLPDLGEDLSGWTAWNGTDEITATNDYKICIAEVDAGNFCIGAGRATVVTYFE